MWGLQGSQSAVRIGPQVNDLVGRNLWVRCSDSKGRTLEQDLMPDRCHFGLRSDGASILSHPPPSVLGPV